MLDPHLPPSTENAVRQALAALGVAVCEARHLGSGAGCVVCAPERAGEWLARGVDVYSADWVVR